MLPIAYSAELCGVRIIKYGRHRQSVAVLLLSSGYYNNIKKKEAHGYAIPLPFFLLLFDMLRSARVNKRRPNQPRSRDRIIIKVLLKCAT